MKPTKISMAFFFPFLMFLVAVAPADSQTCWRNSLDPAVALGSVWDGEQIYLTDKMNDRILRISWRDDGSIETEIDSGTDLKPASAARAADGRFVQFARSGSSRTIHWFSPDLKERGFTRLDIPHQKAELALAAHKPSWHDRVIELYDWTVLGDSIFAYGLLGDAKGSSRLIYAFFVYHLRSPGSHHVTMKAHRVMEFPHFDYYTLNFPYMAAVGDRVYFMTLYNYPELYVYDTRNPNAGARYLRVAPDIPVFQRPVPPIENETMLYGIDTDSVPVGLYSNGGFLYLLYRELTEAGGDIAWRMFKLDPVPTKEEVRSLGKVTLPVRADARHMIMLPLPERSSWAGFEIAAGSGGRTRGNVLSMIEIPQDWIDPENRGSPLSKANLTAGICRRVE